MTRANVDQSLDAVEKALAHFARSLEAAGFEAGADTYLRMADVIVAQLHWVKDEDEEAAAESFRRVVELATEVHRQLHPYVEAMERIGALGSLLPAGGDAVDPESLAGRIVTALEESDRPLSMSAIRHGAEAGTSRVKRQLADLVERGIVARVGSGSRVRYALASRT